VKKNKFTEDNELVILILAVVDKMGLKHPAKGSKFVKLYEPDNTKEPKEKK